MLKWLPRLSAIALTLGLLASPGVQASGGANDDGLGAVRDATARFHSLEQANRSGYTSFLACFDQPGIGGMGPHYVNFSDLDTTLMPTEPEAVVYEVNGSRLELVGLEYLVPISAWTSDNPPSLFGHGFYRNDTLGVYFLHAWIWRSNPLGTFANYNPNVRLCPGH